MRLRTLALGVCVGAALLAPGSARAASGCTPTGEPATAPAGTLLETCVLDAQDVGPYDPVYGTVSLDPARSYRLVASGVVAEVYLSDVSQFWEADAVYCLDSPGYEWYCGGPGELFQGWSAGGVLGVYWGAGFGPYGNPAPFWAVDGTENGVLPTAPTPPPLAADNVYEATIAGVSGVLAFLQQSNANVGGFVVELWAAGEPPPDEPPGQTCRGPAGRPAEPPSSCPAPVTCFGKEVNFDFSGADTPINYVIRTTEGDDVIVGSDWADTIESLGGADFICSGRGEDTIYAGSGNDRIDGGADRDTIDGEEDRDIIHGGPGDDSLTGGVGAARDVLFGEGGWDILLGGGGPDHLKAGLDYDNDPYEVRHRANRLSGGAGHDDLKGSVWMDELHGGGGEDDLYGNLGEDKLYGEAGADTLRGGQEDDKLYFDRQDDRVDGGGGDDDVCIGPFLAIIRLFLVSCETVRRP